jgi:Lipocalin-like domain
VWHFTLRFQNCANNTGQSACERSTPGLSDTMHCDRRLLLSAPLLATIAGTLSRVRAETTSIVGTWELLHLYDENAGREVDVFGSDPKGRLTFDSARFFSFILVTDSPLISPSCSRSTAPITRDAAGPGMIAYYGRYTIGERKTVAFRIERGLTEGWKRSDREAEFKLAGDRMNLVSSFNSLTGSDYSHLTLGRICEYS